MSWIILVPCWAYEKKPCLLFCVISLSNVSIWRLKNFPYFLLSKVRNPLRCSSNSTSPNSSSPLISSAVEVWWRQECLYVQNLYCIPQFTSHLLPPSYPCPYWVFASIDHAETLWDCDGKRSRTMEKGQGSNCIINVLSIHGLLSIYTYSYTSIAFRSLDHT